MKLVYAPEGTEAQSWEFDPNKIMSPEAEAIERETGWTFAEFGQQFLKGSTTARHALLWIMLKRKTPGLRYADVQFAMNEVDVVYSDDELVAVVEALREKAKSVGLDDKEQAALDGLSAMLPEEVAADPLPFEEEALAVSGLSSPED